MASASVMYRRHRIDDATGRFKSQCIGLSVDWVPEVFRSSAVVFTGTLLENQGGERMTFRAERIWKGKPESSKIVIDVLGERNTESYEFREGQTYLIFARVLSSADVIARKTVPPNWGISRPCG